MVADRQRPIEGTRLAIVAGIDKGYVPADGYEPTEDLDKATVTTSLVQNPEKFGTFHKLVLDLDLPAKLIPSSTDGHFHLYVDREIPETAYWKLIHAFVDAGLVEEGYLGASEQRGFTAVRLPWIRKVKPSGYGS